MNGLTKIRAGSLQFVIFIGAIIAVLLLAFVLLAHTHLLFSKKTDRHIATVQQADLAMQLYLQQEKEGLDLETLTLDDAIEIKMNQDPWGLFEINTVIASFQQSSTVKVALIGSKIPDTETALFLKDNLRPMIIVGSAKIRGDALLPQQGIRPGNIAGRSFHNRTLVLGKQKNSTPSLPKPSSKAYERIERLLGSPPGISNIRTLQSLDQNKLSNSFLEPTIFIQGDLLNLKGKTLTGNIVVKATTRILVDATTQLTDVILVAPEIVLADKVTGNFQAIASKHIGVGKNCNLEYPSSLVVLQRNGPAIATNRLPKPTIDIKSGSSIKGSVCYWGTTEERIFYPQIKVDKNAKVIGQLYCTKNVELKGEVWGKVTTDSFIALENGSIYQNHLYDGVIDRAALPNEFVGLGTQESLKKGVAKWLY